MSENKIMAMSFAAIVVLGFIVVFVKLLTDHIEKMEALRIEAIKSGVTAEIKESE